MSRPFSYSDENFTVIGNVLFCHIKIKKRILNSNPIVEIPPEIYDRMLITGQKFNKEGGTLNVIYTGNSIDVGVKQLEDKRYVLFAQDNIYETGLYLVGYFILKDI